MFGAVGNSAKKPLTKVAIRLRHLRDLKGWTQEQLAQAAGLAKVTVTFIETGRTPHPDHETLSKLAKAFRVAVADLTAPEGAELDLRRAVEAFVASPHGGSESSTVRARAPPEPSAANVCSAASPVANMTVRKLWTLRVTPALSPRVPVAAALTS